MNHHNKNKKFGRKTDERRALMRSLAEGLIKHGRITITEAKAKSLRPYVEKLITKAKVDSVANRRLLITKLGTKVRTEQLYKIAPRFKERAGGYTRIVKLPRRAGDASPMAIIEFV